jgi:hypothetical protein
MIKRTKKESDPEANTNSGRNLSKQNCRRGETTYAMGWLKWGPNWVMEDSGEGCALRSTPKRNTRSTQVRGSRKEITPLLLHYSLYKWINGVYNNGASKLSVRGGR